MIQHIGLTYGVGGVSGFWLCYNTNLNLNLFKIMPLLFVLGRILLGGYFLMNGYHHFKNLEGNVGYAKSKGVLMPKLAVGFTGLLLLVGGASVITGFATNVGLAALILFLIPVTFQMHAFWKESDPMIKMGEKINFEKNLALLGAVLMLLVLGVPWMNSF